MNYLILVSIVTDKGKEYISPKSVKKLETFLPSGWTAVKLGFCVPLHSMEINHLDRWYNRSRNAS